MKANIIGEKIIFDSECEICPHCTISTEYGGQILIRRGVKIRPYAQLLTYGGTIQIGENTIINQFSVLYGHGNLDIGKNVLIAPHCIFIPANHKYSDPNKLICQQGEERKGIKIMDNVWIGTNSVILDGVTIESGSVIGAGSVVTKNIPKNSVFGGNPAKLLKQRDNRRQECDN